MPYLEGDLILTFFFSDIWVMYGNTLNKPNIDFFWTLGFGFGLGFGLSLNLGGGFL